jgi:hypothetical protein
MITLDPIQVCELPISPQQLGFPDQADCGNAMLLVATEMQPAAHTIYQLMGEISEGICITCCSPKLYAILEQMQLRWCPWPDRGLTLTLLPHSQIPVLADRLVLSLRASDRDEESSHVDEKEASCNHRYLQ